MTEKDFSNDFPVKISILNREMETITRFFLNSAIAGPLSEYVNKIVDKRIGDLEKSIIELKKRIQNLEGNK